MEKNLKVVKFIFVLLGIIVAVLAGRALLMPDYLQPMTRAILDIVFEALYILSPALSVFIVEKGKVRTIASEYLITFKGINWKSFAKYLLATIILLPIIFLLFTFLLGNLGGIKIFGSVADINIQSLSIFSRTTLLGISFMAITSFLGEIAWRGLLMKEPDMSDTKKNIVTDVIWSFWSLPLFSNLAHSFQEYIMIALLVLFMCVVSSFFLWGAVKQSRSLITAAFLQGIITAFPVGFLVYNFSQYSYAITSRIGLLYAFSILILVLIFRKRKKRV